MNYSIDLAVAKSVIEIAKSLKIQAVAEGIETEAQREMLTAYGCYVHQGYLFAKPMPIDEFESYCLAVEAAAKQKSIVQKATAPKVSVPNASIQIQTVQKHTSPKQIVQKIYVQKTIQQRTKH